MRRFFPTFHSDAIRFTTLSKTEMDFRAKQASGIIERESENDKLAVLVIAGGSPVRAYAIENDIAVSTQIFEFLNLKTGATYQAAALPDTAARLVWLALESVRERDFSISESAGWAQFLDGLRTNQWTGIIEILNSTLSGFMVFKTGHSMPSDSVFHTSDGFTNRFEHLSAKLNFPALIRQYEISPRSNAYQCFLLRNSMVHWSSILLPRCQEIIGTRMLTVIERDINQSIHPWKWQLRLGDQVLADEHFFPGIQEAAAAYRAILLGMGTQLNFFVGKTIAQRIFNETFELLAPDEKEALINQRLIPAAFTV
ncbi:MAG: hypothetical protein HXY38_12195 [Chloroflexi bacterium]|nr:hypothetical protein [Chloroflexota bacterium]